MHSANSTANSLNLLLKPCKNIPFLFCTKIFKSLMKGLFLVCIAMSLLLTYSSLFGSGRLLYFNYKTATNNKLERTNLSQIVFGIGGTTKIWGNRRNFIESWWRVNVTRGYVWLDEPPTEWPSSSPPYKISEDTTRFKYTAQGPRAAIRIARIVKETFELGFKDVRWFVMGDDDTVFFLENLITVLGKYDYRQMYYIGGISECIEQAVVHSFDMGYGGGGFAISYPLAAALVKILDGCIDRYASFYGSDHKVGACVNEIGVPLTKELGFHQADIRRDPYGLLAAHPLAPLVSLHHLEYFRPIFPGFTQVASIRKLVQAHMLDPGRTLQQSFCYDLAYNWSVSVSWGYTVQIYPFLVNANDLKTPFSTFSTWMSWSQGPFTFKTRDLDPDPCKRPIIYFLDHVEEAGKGQTFSSYKRFLGDRFSGDQSGKDCENREYAPALSIQSVRVSSPVFDPDTWKKAPRRHCCDVVKEPSEGPSTAVSVKIRGCKDGESVSPP